MKMLMCGRRSLAALALGLLLGGLTAADTVTVTTEAELTASLVSGTTIILWADILLRFNVYINDGQTSLVIDGQGLYKLDGQRSVPCITISGAEVEVQLKNLIITNGFNVRGALRSQPPLLRLPS